MTLEIEATVNTESVQVENAVTNLLNSSSAINFLAQNRARVSQGLPLTQSPNGELPLN